MTPAERKRLITDVGQFVVQEIAYALKPLKEQMVALQARIEELEQRGWKGDYQRAVSYPRHSLVRFNESLWSCIQDAGPNEIPGQSNKWQLSVKRGDIAEPRQPTKPRTLHDNRP
jgi:hypothetical protein